MFGLWLGQALLRLMLFPMRRLASVSGGGKGKIPKGVSTILRLSSASTVRCKVIGFVTSDVSSGLWSSFPKDSVFLPSSSGKGLVVW